MANNRSTKDFLAFILDLEAGKPNVEEKVEGFVSKKTPQELYDFFQKWGYTEIKLMPDCKDILTIRHHLEEDRVPSLGTIRDPACPGKEMGY